MATDYKQELVDLVNEKSREYRDPLERYNYFKTLALLAKHEAEHARVALMRNIPCDYEINQKLDSLGHLI